MWIGDNPNIQARRRYMRAYLEWRLLHKYVGKKERDLRDLAERRAAMTMIKLGALDLVEGYFEWLIDQNLWDIWLGELPDTTPPFPWLRLQDDRG
ncbi:hypothetical protein ACHAPT_003819 [Fusarium lateritium]